MTGTQAHAFSAMLAGVLIAGNAHAQSTWIVDKSNGPGSHFTSIQAAVDAAKPNDILELRAGTYEGFTISKGLRLLADPGVWVNTGQGFSGKQVVVTGLALGEAVVLRGFAIDDAYGLGMSVLVAKNQGTAHFEHIRFLAPPTGTSSPAVRIDASLGVSFRRCDISSGVNAIDSAVMLTETSVRRSPDPTQILSSYAAVTATRSRITIAECTLQGQNGVPPYNQSQPAVHATSSSIKIAGTPKSTIRAGGSRVESVPALLGDAASSLMFDPRPQLMPSGSAKDHVGFGTAQLRTVTYLSFNGGKLGGTLDLAQHGAAGEFFSLSLSVPREPFYWPPFGHVWLNQPARIHLLAGLYDATGQIKATLPVPNQAGLRGLPIGVQVAAGPWPDLVYSNAVFVTLY